MTPANFTLQAIEDVLGDDAIAEFTEPYTVFDDDWVPGYRVRRIERDVEGIHLTLLNDIGWEMRISGINRRRMLRVTA